MSSQPVVYSIKRWQLITVVLGVVFVAVSLPVGVLAATGSFVNLRDYSNAGATGYSRVINNRLVTEQCDGGSAPVNSQTCARVIAGKTSVGDGSGPLTVDGTVQVTPTTPFLARPQGTTDTSFYPSGSVALPAGKRFAIETVSVAVAVPSGQPVLDCWIHVVTGGTRSFLDIPLVKMGTYSGLDYYTGALNTRLYADVDTSVGVEAFRGASTGTASVNSDLSGYLY